jgi:2',3'-cyclic-nucleotide 2'-phosphodiesterase (5'-nucleotidase family)
MNLPLQTLPNVFLKKARFIVIGLLLGAASCQTAYQPALQNKENIEITAALPQDSAMAAFIAPYARQLNDTMNTIIGYAALELDKKNPYETLLGNFVADLTREHAARRVSYPVDLAAFTTGGLRINLPEGPISIGTVFELMPFENEVIIARLAGAEMEELLQYAVNSRSVAVSNVHIKAQGNQLQEVLIGGEPFDRTRTYTVATTSYHAEGGDNMHFFRSAQEKVVVGILLRDAITTHIQELHARGERISAAIEGRITVNQ